MKRITRWAMTGVIMIVASGCAEYSTTIKSRNTSTRSDVFEDVTNPAMPKGYSDIRFTASLKTHKPSIYSASDNHGTNDYKLLLNIDGQAAFLQGDPQQEDTETFKMLSDPEAGKGVRYRFNKHLRLKSGVHNVVVALPEDGISVEREVTLKEGEINRLVVEPVYCFSTEKKPTGNLCPTSFKSGIRSIRLSLNGQEL